MSEKTAGVSAHRRASPWPLLIAFGLALSELGVFVGLYPVAVGGLLLLGGSVAGILVESGYAGDLWRPLAGIGVAFGALGVAVVGTQVDPATFDALAVFAEPNGIVGRGLAIFGAGLTLLAVGLVGHLLE